MFRGSDRRVIPISRFPANPFRAFGNLGLVYLLLKHFGVTGWQFWAILAMPLIGIVFSAAFMITESERDVEFKQDETVADRPKWRPSGPAY